jgi:predicted anti-sigma-YlaC factor YlaD
MNCEQVAPYLPGIAGAELGAESQRWIDAHLQTCASCRAEAGRYRSVAAGMTALSQREVEPPAFLVDSILERVESEAHRRYLPVPPVIPAELVRVVQDNREALTSVAGVALTVGALYALWRRMRANRTRVAL